MSCYKDRTFCPFYLGCAGGKLCVRSLTPSVKRAANEFGLPVSVYSKEPYCFKKKPVRPKLKW